MTLKKITVILILILSFMRLYSARLTVTVLDSLQAMPEAAVILTNQNLQQTTDKRGKAIFENVNPGIYTLVVMLNGYNKYTKDILVPVEGLKVMAKISPKAYDLGELTVSAKRTKGKTETKTTIQQEEIQAVSQSIMQDSIKALQAMPGVSSSGGSFDSRMYIQGGASYEWIASLDGVMILDPMRWGGNISMFNPNIVDTIDLYTAGYPCSFGQGLSGIVNVESIKGNKDQWKLYYEQTYVSSEIQLEGPVSSNFTIFFNTRRTYYDLVAPLLFTGNDWKGVQFPYLWDGLLRMNWEITPADTLSFTGYGSLEGMKWKLANSGGPSDLGTNAEFYYQTINLIGSLRYKHNFANSDSFDLTAAYTPVFSEYNLGNSPIVKENSIENDYFYQMSANYYMNSITNHKIQAGIMGFYADPVATDSVDVYSLNLQDEWTNAFSLHKTFGPMDIYYGGIYAMDNWEFVPSWIVQFGARGEYFTPNHEFTLDPQAGIKYETTKELDLFFRTGLYSLFPVDLLEIDPTYGNTNLVGEKVMHYIAGLDFANEKYTFRAEGFIKQYHDLVEGDISNHYNNNGIRNVYGGDVYLQKKAIRGDWLSGWISYTYVYGAEEITARSDPTPQENYDTPLNEFFTPNYLRNHTLSSIIELTYYKGEKASFFDFLDNCKISFDYKFLSGQPYTPATNFLSNQTPAGAQYKILYGKYDSETGPLYSKLDVKVTVPGSIFSIMSLFGIENFETYTYVSFINILNTKNITGYYYSVQDNQLQRLESIDYPFMPVVGMTLKMVF